MRKKLLGWVAAHVFLLGMALMTIPDLYRRRFAARKDTDPSTERRLHAHWQLTWARFYFSVFERLLDIRMPIKVHGKIPPGKPCILVLNHRTVLDHLLAARVAAQLGVTDIRWVLKTEMRPAPFVGESLFRAGCAFVSRNGDAQDKAAIADMAAIARADGASVAIYPEGTRHDGIPRRDARYCLLREPKRGGLQVLLDALPDYDIVFVCLNWEGLQGGKTMWDGEGFVGIHGRVTVWQLTRVPGDGAQNILGDGWARMDALLTPTQIHTQALRRVEQV